jgi:hypothetical protein
MAKIAFGNAGDGDRHIEQCEHDDHVAFVFGVYDQHGQRVNGFRSLACNQPPGELVDFLREQARLWPGFRLYGWSDPEVNPPEKIHQGPAPDATVCG